MSLFAPSDAVQSVQEEARRVLIIVDAGSSALAPALTQNGYQVTTVPLRTASWALKTKTPDLVLLELYQGFVGGNTEALYLARRLRTEPESYATPLVIAWGEEQSALQQAAAYMGADDYFALSIPVEIMLARLDSLFWRVAVGRRTATLIGDQRLEIENFILLTDAVRWDMERGWGGTLALVQAINRDTQNEFDRNAQESALTAICGFLQLQMRRMDSVVFYDVSTLLVYLPHLPTLNALGALTRLRGEFLEAQKSCDMAIGLVSFPSDSSELEELLEMAATALLQSHNNEFRRVVAYGAQIPEAAQQWETNAHQPDYEIVRPSPAETLVKPVRSVPEWYDKDTKKATVTGPATLTFEPAPAPPEELPEPAMPPLPDVFTDVVLETLLPAPPAPLGFDDLIPTPTPPAFHHTSDLALDVPLPNVPQNLPGARVASVQEIEQSLRPPEGCRLLLAVSRPERMAQLNTLARSAGYEVRPAFDGPHALGLLRIDRPGLMLLDYEVSGLNGLETLRRIQAQHSGRLPVKVILLVPPGPLEIKAEAEALGVYRVLTLPYAPIELLAAMRQAVSTN